MSDRQFLALYFASGLTVLLGVALASPEVFALGAGGILVVIAIALWTQTP